MSRRERRLAARKYLTEAPTEQVSHKKTGKVGKFFDKHYHKLQFLPLLVLILSIGFNVAFFVNHGDFVNKGVSLAGGTAVTVGVQTPIDVHQIEQTVSAALPGADISVRILRSGQSQTGFTVESTVVNGDSKQTEAALVNSLKSLYPTASYSTETISSTLGDAFFRQTAYAVLAAFILMAIVVFISFRTFYPSMAVVLAGFSTAVSTLAVFNLIGMQLSTAGVAAFLMLIGYSIDTDILLSTRVLKRGGEFIQNVWSAAKTGLTMQFTTAMTVTVVLIFSNNPVFTQIMSIILIGMFFDVLYTWIQNAAILKWYIEKKEVRK